MENLIGYYDYTTNYREDVITLLKLACNELSKLNGNTDLKTPDTEENYYYGDNSFVKSRCYGCTLGPDYCKNSAVSWTFTPTGWLACPYGTDMYSRHIFG